MGWKAVDEVETAFDATKRLLWPFQLRRWLVLGIVAFFVSGATGFNPSPSFTFDVDVPTAAPTPVSTPEAPIDDSWMWVESAAVGAPTAFGVVLLFGVLAVVLGIVLAYVAAVLELVFVEIARSEEVRLRGFFGDHVRTGGSLFLFRVGVALTLFATGVFVLLLTVLTGGLFLILLLLVSPVLVAFAVGIWVLLRFTTDFVVPVMTGRDVGVIAGWRAFWPELRADWKQYGMYAVVRFLLGIAASIVVGIGFAVVLVALGIPFGIVGVGGGIVASELLGLAVLARIWVAVVALLLGVSVLVVGTVLVQVPVQTYLRYYSLFVLGAITPSFDLVGHIREDLDSDHGTTESDSSL